VRCAVFITWPAGLSASNAVRQQREADQNHGETDDGDGCVIHVTTSDPSIAPVAGSGIGYFSGTYPRGIMSAMMGLQRPERAESMEESGNFVWPQDWGDCKRCSTLPQLIKPVGVLKECSEEIVARTKDRILPILKAKCPPQNPHPHIETLYVTITGCPIVFWTAVFSCEPYPQAKYPHFILHKTHTYTAAVTP
jgi:hypothetical protein